MFSVLPENVRPENYKRTADLSLRYYVITSYVLPLHRIGALRIRRDGGLPFFHILLLV